MKQHSIVRNVPFNWFLAAALALALLGFGLVVVNVQPASASPRVCVAPGAPGFVFKLTDVDSGEVTIVDFGAATVAPSTFFIQGFGPFVWVPEVLVDFDNCFGSIGDGRINDGPIEIAAPLAAYCGDEGSISVWDIDNSGTGSLDFVAGGEAISNALTAAEGASNQLVGEGPLGNQLWALNSGALQLSGPGLPGEESKTYNFTFNGDTCPA